MKTLFFLTVCLSTATSAISQKLDIPLFEQLTTKSVASLDRYMIDYYGYEKIQNRQEDQLNKYGRTYHNDLENTIVVTVIPSKEDANAIDISLAKNYNVQEIKDQLLSQGYTYTGLENFEFSKFRKQSLMFLVSEIPSDEGKTQVKVISK